MPELCKKLIAYCADNGLIVINAGVNGNVIRVLSPLVIEEELLQKGLDIIEGGLHQLLGDKTRSRYPQKQIGVIKNKNQWNHQNINNI